MGVTGLLQQLRDIQEKTSLSKYKGKTLAVDTYGWLHRGLISCAQDLCTDVPTRGYITSVMRKVEMVRHFGVEPFMVFDGAALPTKEGTQAERRQKREKAREAANKYLERGDRKSAWKEFMKAAAVTPEMAKSVMVELDRAHVKYIVAPYEADPQMVYLEKIGVVDGILSEDSDLLVFGCRRLITKLNEFGECVEICRDNFGKVPRMALDTFTANQWRLVAILSGCDYTKGIPGVGLKTAFNIVRRIQDIPRVIESLTAENKQIPAEFLEEATKADLAFQYQKVFNPFTYEVTELCEITADADLDTSALELCCGRRLEKEIHKGICLGKLNPFSHQQLISREQNLSVTRSHSVNIPQPTKSSTGPVKPVVAQMSQSFSSSKSIDTYFRSQKTLKPAENEFVKPMNSLKRPSESQIKLSPSSKKLKKLQGVVTPCADGTVSTTSKFFSSTTISIPPVTVSLAFQKPSDADLGFITGDSEVPEESSSPVRPEAAGTDSGAITDNDDDNDAGARLSEAILMTNSVSTLMKNESDGDDGYENELDDSPVKPRVVCQFLRKKFSMDPNNDDKMPHLTKRDSLADITNESIDSSSPPTTPEEFQPSGERSTSQILSQTKSSEQPLLTDSEDGPISSPHREHQPLPPKRSTRTLRSFAFTGK